MRPNLCELIWPVTVGCVWRRGEWASAARLPSQGEQRRARRGRHPDRGDGVPRRGAAASAASATGAPPPPRTCRRPLGGEEQRGAAPGRRGGPSAVGGPTAVGPARADRSAVGPARAIGRREHPDRDGGGVSCRSSGSISLHDTRSHPEVRPLPSAAEAVAGASGDESPYLPTGSPHALRGLRQRGGGHGQDKDPQQGEEPVQVRALLQQDHVAEQRAGRMANARVRRPRR